MIVNSLLRKPVLSLFIILVSVAILLVACSQKASEVTRDVTINNVQVTAATATQPYIFKTSEPGSITVLGTLILLNPLTLIPAPEDSVFLVSMPVDQPISGIPQFEVGKVPQAEVDEITGDFVFTNIQPGQYAVVVVTIGGAQIPVHYLGTSNYGIITLDASQVDTTVELGDLTLP
jgi:hypothetical protein